MIQDSWLSVSVVEDGGDACVVGVSDQTLSVIAQAIILADKIRHTRNATQLTHLTQDDEQMAHRFGHLPRVAVQPAGLLKEDVPLKRGLETATDTYTQHTMAHHH